MWRRKLTTTTRLWHLTGILGAVVVATAAVAVILTLRGQADRASAAALATLRLSLTANVLNGLEWEAKAQHGLRPDTSAALDRALLRITREQRSLATLDTEQHAAIGVSDAVERYVGGLLIVRRYLVQGDLRDADRVDERLVDPAFDELASVLRRAGLVEAVASRHAARRADVGTVAVIVVATSLLLGLLALRRGEARRVAARVQRARTEAILQDSSDLITLVGPDARIVSVSQSVEGILGFEPAELEGRHLWETIHAEDWPIVAAVLRDAPSGVVAQKRADWRFGHRNGYWLDVETVVNNRLDDPRVRAVVLTTRDVSERKAFEEQLRHRAFHDPLTQLPNRALFYDRTEHALTREQRFEQLVAVVFVDLDDFKLVNDALGHAAGDELLVCVAQRLRASIRSADTAARLGGDEFAVLIEGVAGPEEARRGAQRILDAFGEAFTVGGTSVSVRPSIGVAMAKPEDSGVDELHRNADLAMYAAKTAGKGRIELFHADLHADFERRFPSESEEPDRITWFMRTEEQRTEIVRLLADPGSIVAVYQPILDLRTAELAGYEALARFPTAPEQRPPHAWFAQAHRFDLGFALEIKALHAALAAGGRPDGTYLSLNISPSAMRDERFEVLYERDLSDIVIEMTEHDMVVDSAWLELGLSRLRERGARIAVDDAGSGYVGLRQLMTLRPDIVKLDRQLVDGVAEDDAKRALTESFVHFADRIDATICAEGIERLEDLAALVDLGVTYGQGYAIARPAPPWATPGEDAVAACVRPSAAPS